MSSSQSDEKRQLSNIYQYCLLSINKRWLLHKGIKMRIATAKAYNRKISPLTRKLNFEKNWIGVISRALLYMAQRPGH